MAGEKTPASSWCHLRSSQRLRAVVKFKVEKLNKTWSKISEETGIPRDRISLYVNGTSRKGITQYQLIRLCRYLGIEVKLDISLSPGETVSV